MRAKPTGKYRSKFESKVGASLGESWEYETHDVGYSVLHNYTPDFTKGKVHIEAKAFFRPGDQRKYLAIAEALRSEGQELVFVFSQPSKPVRKRAKMTMGQWCDKHEIRYCSAASCRGFFDA